MSQITRFIGTDPNGTQSSMAKVIVSNAGFLSIANLPYDEKYTFRFWIKTSAIVNGIALQKDDTVIENITSTTSWQKITAKFEGTTGQDVKFYLPQGTYYFWHSKLEVGTMESDYSQSQKDFELQVVETRLELNSRINQTSESITQEVTRAKNAEENLSSKVEQTAESITSTVAKSIKNYDESNININIYGFGEPQSSYHASADYDGKYYLDQTTGMTYRCSYSQASEDYIWTDYLMLPTIQDSATSEIEQTATSITSTVAQTQNIWLEEHPVGTPITIKYKGYGAPLSAVNPTNNPYPNFNVNDLYLNINNGSVYRLASASATSSNISFTWAYIYSLTAINAELESKIEQTAESITSTVAMATNTYDTSKFSGTIHLYGYGNPELLYPASATYIDKNYLDQMEGKVYSCFEFTNPSGTTYGWNAVKTLPYISNELSSRIEQTLSSISFTLTKQDEDTAVLSMNYTKEDGSVITLSAQSIQFTGLVEFTDLSGNGTTSINGANIQTGTLSADKITTGTMSCDRLNGGTISGQAISGGTIFGTSISGADISSSTIITDHLYMPTILSQQNGIYIDYEGTTNPVCMTLHAYGLSKGVKVHGGLHIADNTISLDDRGNAGIYSPHILNYLVREYPIQSGQTVQWVNAFGNRSQNTVLYGATCYLNGTSTVITSDRRYKDEINSLENYEDMYYELKPVSFKVKDGESGRRHIGFIAQDVKESIENNGLKTDEFAGYVEYPTDHEIYPYIKTNTMSGLRYDEFIALNTHMIQKQHKEIESLKSELATLKEQVAFLMQREKNNV